jgi:hypothetical protein
MRSVSDSIDATSVAGLGSDLLAAAAERAVGRQVTVYALDASSSAPLASASAEYRSIDTGRSGGAAPTDTWTPGFASRRRSEVQNALQTVAEATGGRLLGDERDDVVQAVLEDLETYYSLGILAPGTGVAEPVEVSVRGRGLRVHHRRAARSRSRHSLDADRTVAALLAGEEPGGNPLGARLVIGAITATDEEPWSVPLAIRIPVDALKVTARGGEHTGQVSIFVVARDGRGRLSEIRRAILPIALPNTELATAAGREAEYRVDLRLAPGPSRIAVAVRDDLDPALSLVTADVEVGSGPLS